ncbi:MAG: TetR/AcrR family transcriptional regulator [Acidimicrobiales bacterium]
MVPVRARARRGDGDRLRGEILTAAERLLIETGSEEAVSIRAVAEATGVTPPSIYRHFSDKAHLLFEVCQRQFDLLDDAIEAACGDVEDPIEAMRERGRAYVRFGMAHPEHYRIMFMGPSYEIPEKWEDLLSSGSFANLMGGLQAVVEAGLTRPGIDLFTMALHVWSNIHGLTSLLVARPTLPWPDLDAFIDEHLDLCLAPHLA